MSICNENCKNCYYYATFIGCCDYLLTAGRPRQCPAGDGCAKKLVRLKGAPKIDDGQAWRLYEKERLSDAEIAAALGTKRLQIFKWRKAFGYPPNKRGSIELKREPTKPPEIIMERWTYGDY